MKHILSALFLFVFYAKAFGQPSDQKPAPAYRDYVYQWAYEAGNERLDLDMQAALVITNFVAALPESQFETWKMIFRVEFNLGARSQQDFATVVQALQQDSQTSDWVDRAQARAQSKHRRIEQFNAHFRQAYSSEAKPNLAFPVGNALSSLHLAAKDEALAKALIELTAAEIRRTPFLQGANFQKVVENLEDEVRKGTDSGSLIAEYKMRTKVADNYVIFYNYAYNSQNQGLDLGKTGAAGVAEFLSTQPDSSIPDLKNLFNTFIQMNGRDDRLVLNFISEIKSAANQQGGIQGFVAKVSRQQSHFNWAIEYVAYNQQKPFEQKTAQLIAKTLNEVPAESIDLLKAIIPNLYLSRGPENLSSTLNELKNISNDIAALKALLPKSEVELKKAQYRGGIYYWAYNSGGENLNLGKSQALLLADFLYERPESLLPLYKEIFRYLVLNGFNSNSTLQAAIKDIKGIDDPKQLEQYKHKVKTQHEFYTWMYSAEGIYQVPLRTDVAQALAIEVSNQPREQIAILKKIFLNFRKQGKTPAIVELSNALIAKDLRRIKEATNYFLWSVGPGNLAVCRVKNAVDPDFDQLVDSAKCFAELATDFKLNSKDECWEVAADIAPIRKVERVLCDNPLILDIKKAVHSFSRPIHLYHYVEANRLGIRADERINSWDDRVKNHHIEWTAFFWDLKRQNQSTNSGLYTAIDPGVSRNDYGQSRPVLYRVEFTSDLNYISYKEVSNLTISQGSISYLAKNNCRISHLSVLWNRNAALSPECLKIQLSLVRDMNIAAMSYGWGAAAIPNCTGNVQEAYIIMNQNILTPERVRIFNHDEIPNAPADYKEAQHIHRFLMETRQNPIWPADKLPIPNEDEHMAWKNANLLNCR